MHLCGVSACLVTWCFSRPNQHDKIWYVRNDVAAQPELAQFDMHDTFKREPSHGPASLYATCSVQQCLDLIYIYFGEHHSHVAYFTKQVYAVPHPWKTVG